MKTSNKLLLGLFIAILIGITVNIILIRNAIKEKINKNVSCIEQGLQ
jgi:ABC-type nitrate/sulfonate/bicarbonate transport system permease component